MGNSNSHTTTSTPTAKWLSSQNPRFQSTDSETSQEITISNKPFQHTKPLSLNEPAFSGYVAGWRQGDFDDDAQEFSFATFQSAGAAGYEGDDEDEAFSQLEGRESRPPDWPLGPGTDEADERTWKERKHSPSPPGEERVGRAAVREAGSAQVRSQTISCPTKYFSARTTAKRQNSSHSAVLGRQAGQGPVAKVSMSRLREVAKQDAAKR